MASIIKKRKGNQVYYYAAECKRLNGKPRIVWQKYLGKLDDIVRRPDSGQAFNPSSGEIFSFGSVAALWSITRRLRLTETIDRVVPKREQGPSVGEYMLIAAINRAVEPTSINARWGSGSKAPPCGGCCRISRPGISPANRSGTIWSGSNGSTSWKLNGPALSPTGEALRRDHADPGQGEQLGEQPAQALRKRLSLRRLAGPLAPPGAAAGAQEPLPASAGP